MTTRVAFTLIFASLATSCAGPARGPVSVSALEGGTVIASTHAIDIPPMALAADTAVSLRTSPAADYPALDGALSEVLVIEPDGAMLAQPAAVTVHGEFIAAADAATVSIAQLITGDGVSAWSFVESARDTETGDVTVHVDRFAPLAVVVTEPAVGAGQIRGSIVWGDGTPVAGAPIQLFRMDTRLVEQAADDAGRFTFGDLEPASYLLVVEYECMLSEAVEVTAGEVAEIALTLCGG